MKGTFEILINGKRKIYTDYYDIPEQIGAVISFAPTYPEPPHTDEEHEFMHTFHEKLQSLVKRESCQLQ